MNHLNYLSYIEISHVAQYLDHEEILKFRQLNKACNISACLAINKNLKDFEYLRKGARHLEAEKALGQALPLNMEELCG